jgi:hypothetical protein
VQPWNDGPQANNDEINTHGVAQQPWIHHDKDAKNKSNDAPYEADWLKHGILLLLSCAFSNLPNE